MRKPKQLEFKKVKGWGGKRKGAGRKNKSGQVSHAKRESISAKTPLHITMKIKPGIRDLRTPKIKAALEKCIEKAKEKGLGVLHFSIQPDHLHTIVESVDNEALAKGMNSLGASFAKAIRRIRGGKGPVFKGRYHVHVLKSPSEMRNALAYVLTNRSKHLKFQPYVDDFSSAEHFKDWKLLIGKTWMRPDLQWPAHLSKPKSWLAREGWRRATT